MKIKIYVALLLIPFWANSQTKKSGFVFFESGVTRLRTSPKTFGSCVNYYKIPTELFTEVSFPKNASSSVYRNDTLISENSDYISISPESVDFRSISIGFGKILSNKKKIRIDHAIGLNYSIANFSIGTLANKSIEKQNTKRDGSGNAQTEFINSNNSILGYGKVRNAGVTYQNTITLKNFIHRIDFSGTIRQNLFLKFEDKLMVLQTETHDTTSFFPYGEESCGGMGIGVVFSDVNFYRKQLPPTENYKTYTGKMGLQYQMTFFARMSLSLGKNYRTKFYTQIGASPITFYGKQLKTNSSLNYGIGILQDLDFSTL